MIRVECPSCQQAFGAADQHAGKQTSCPQCGASIVIPTATPAATPATAPRSPAARPSGAWGALAKMSVALATPFGIVFYVVAALLLLGGLVAALFVGDFSGSAGVMVLLYTTLGAIFVFSQGMALHMLGALLRLRWA
jgi:hypothetical protein